MWVFCFFCSPCSSVLRVEKVCNLNAKISHAELLLARFNKSTFFPLKNHHLNFGWSRMEIFLDLELYTIHCENRVHPCFYKQQKPNKNSRTCLQFMLNIYSIEKVEFVRSLNWIHVQNVLANHPSILSHPLTRPLLSIIVC